MSSQAPEKVVTVGAQYKNDVLSLLALSFVGSLLVAVAFVITLNGSLPETDGAYGQTLLLDPLVLGAMSIGAALASVLAFAFAFLLLRRTDLENSFRITLLSSLAGVLLITPLYGQAGLLAAFAFMLGGMLFSRWRCAF